MSLTQPGAHITVEQFFREYPFDGRSYELIDGELCEMTTANIRHQRIARRLFLLFNVEVSKTGGEVFPPGVGVVVGDDTVQVPDLAVLTRPLQQPDIDYGLVTPPDIVVEILSPSTAKYDRTEKSARYAAFGVPELWIVSPEAEIIEVLALAEGRYSLHTRAGFDEPVSSNVLPGLSFPASAAFAG